jgi:hypothetical protein
MRNPNDDSYANIDRGALLLSIFDRVKPSQNDKSNNFGNERYELQRRASRQVDASGIISAGQLLVFAQSSADAPLPFPIEISGEPTAGKGTVYYQFVVPLGRVGAATQPIEIPHEDQTSVEPAGTGAPGQ